MNRSKLKSYAPKAREEFRRAVSDRARKIGLDPVAMVPFEESGDYVFINGQPFPRAVGAQRRALEKRVAEDGFDGVIEEVAYTWFNRFMAIRFMELHGYLDHGFRVLSHPSGKERPQILDEAENVSLPGLDRERVIELKLDGTKDDELYKLLLLAQCRALNHAMPFLFEPIDDETEALLPDNLLASDSPIRRMVTQIEESDWDEVEIIGWLYQFYISQKKDEVIGKVVKPADIPAATQLFTPNWIVKYMVHNSLGRQWLATYPNSPLRAQMEYFIEPAAQSEDVSTQLAAITPAALDPEAMTLLDPAAGSGHILVEAYDVFKQIYIERGYRLREIPRLILQKNLFGLDIDDRAAQMAGFALLMKARADDRRILEDAPQLNVCALQNSEGVDAAEVAAALGLDAAEVGVLCALFREAKTFGSLLTIPDEVAARLGEWQKKIEAKRATPNLLTSHAVEDFAPLVQQAQWLARRYDVVVANPPYMGSKGMNSEIKEFAAKNYRDSKSDIFAMFIESEIERIKPHGYAAFVTPFVWMFISSYEKFRKNLIETTPISSLIQLEYNAFEPACVPVCTFTLQKNVHLETKGTFIRLADFKGHQNQAPKTLEAIDNPNCAWRFQASTTDFEKIPGSPIAYWASNRVREIFTRSIKFSEIAKTKHGMTTGNNNKFLRFWVEVGWNSIGLLIPNREDSVSSGKKWFPYNKGGAFRKWYGNNEFIVDYEDGGRAMMHDCKVGINSGFRHDNSNLFFLDCITWTLLSSSFFGVRRSDRGFVFDVNGSSAFPSTSNINGLTGYLCSKVAVEFLKSTNPTLAFQTGNISALPILRNEFEQIKPRVDDIVTEAIQISRDDWNAFETSWDFARSPLIAPRQSTPAVASDAATTIAASFAAWETLCTQRRARLQQLEEENNRLFINAYGLQEELSPEVPDAQITLARADRAADTRRLISYAVGCMMGRYSLDEPGLIYAHSGNADFDAARYFTFPADADGILPVTDSEWFPDDIVNRLVAFVRAVWPREYSEKNLQWIAESLGARAGESPEETVRRYCVADFYKNHLQTYKNRPIYWLFSSGKERAFSALVYLHRYNESTLARMRMEYVVPLQGRLSARSEALRTGAEAATSTAKKRRLEKERTKLEKQRLELARFDEKLRHMADARITLDLDDGVKANYAKFGDLLADVKIVTGNKGD